MTKALKTPIIDPDNKDTYLPALRISGADKKKLDKLCMQTYGHGVTAAFRRKLLFDHFGIKTA